MEMPECPVCLQTYDSEEAIPRVLPCGHSACSPCIAQLAAFDSSSGRSFPDTIRCPACNQVVPCPRGRGPNALPKNIDLLRLCSPPSPSSASCSRPVESRPPERGPAVFFPIPWDEQLFSAWKDWIVPYDSVSVAAVADTAAEAVAATLIRTSSCGRFEERHSVRLVSVGESSSSISTTTGCGQFKLSYTGRVMEALSKLGKKERAELGSIMEISLRQRRGLCRAFGLWMSFLESSPLFLVCERFQFDISRAMDDVAEHRIGLDSDHEVFSFAKLCMESCESFIALHSQGMFCGCLALPCFCFDDYGHCLLDLSEVLLVGRRVRRVVAEAGRSNSRCSLSKGQTFVSPELLTSLYSEHTVSEARSGIDYGSDVWSLACILSVLLVGERQVDVELPEDLTCDNGVELSLDVYDVWKKKVASALEASLLGTKLEFLLPILESCLDYDPVSRLSVSDIWRCIMSIFSKSHCIVPAGLDVPDPRMDILCCLVLGELSSLPKGRNHVLVGTEKLPDDHLFLAFTENSESTGELFHQEKADSDFEGFPDRGLKFVSLQGHQDCITGLAVGGGFLFSSSFDKTVRVWSLEDLSLVQTLRGHEHRVMAILVMDAIKPLCITGDSGGCICAWSIDSSTEKMPIRKWYDHTDWRYSGVHSLAVSGSQYLYSGSGDKTIKAWSLQDYSLTCTMIGHKSAVSSLLASDGILYSGSWDGTIRLWWLHDHSPLTVLGDDELLKGLSVLSLLLHNQLLIASFDNGSLKMWRNDVLVKSTQIQNGALFAVEMDGKWLFMGGWDKIIHIQELSEKESQVEFRSVGSISCDSVVTSLLHWQGKLFAGSYKDIKEPTSSLSNMENYGDTAFRGFKEHNLAISRSRPLFSEMPHEDHIIWAYGVHNR